VQIRVRWELLTTGNEETQSMVGGDVSVLSNAVEHYATSFICEQVPPAEWLLLDLGNNSPANGYGNKTVAALNGVRLGEVNSRRNRIRFCIHARQMRAGRNELRMARHGKVYSAWIRNGPPVERKYACDMAPDDRVTILPFATLGAVTDVTHGERGAVLETSSGRGIGVQFPQPGVVRLTAAAGDPEEVLLVDDLCLVQGGKSEAFKIVRQAGAIQLRSSSLTVVVNEGEPSISIHRLDGTPVRQGLNFWHAEGSVLLTWPLDEPEHIFGLGENTTEGMDKRGKQEDVWVIHSFEKCDKPVPFLLSTSGYGLYLHSSYRAVFDLGKTERQQAFCYVDNDRADAFVLAGERFTEMIRDYTALTGRSPLPPRWAFGYWQSATPSMHQARFEENIDTFARKDIPIDVLGVDPCWQQPGYQSWQWSERYFPEPEKFLAKLKSMGIHLALWTCPFLARSSPLYAEATGKQYVMRDEDGQPGEIDWWMGFDSGLMDFCNPEAAAWWGEMLRPLVASGVSVLKTDGGDTNETPPDLVSVTGHSLRELHNLYPILFAKTVHEAMQRVVPDERILTWIRTGFAGIQRYPCCWGGDQDADFGGGRVLIKAGQQAGLAGIPFWSHDLGGFAGRPTEEYYVRSFQWGLLSSISRAHGSVAAPWEMGERAETIATQYLRLRYRLLPTLYSYAWYSHATGEPMMRALVLDYQDDPNVYQAEYQYKLGPDLLIAPVYEESGTDDLCARRQVYLPEGPWYDYWTDERLTGQQTLTALAPLDTLPVYVRAGAIIVYGPDANRASSIPDRLNVHVYSGGNGNLTYYEDDGHSQAYLAGECATTLITALDRETDLHVEMASSTGEFNGQPERHHLDFWVHGLDSVAGCRVNGTPTTDGIFDERKRLFRISLSKKRFERLDLQIVR